MLTPAHDDELQNEVRGEQIDLDVIERLGAILHGIPDSALEPRLVQDVHIEGDTEEDLQASAQVVEALKQVAEYKKENMKKVYIAGPMRGKPEFNFPLFFHAAKTLRLNGYSVFSPAENDLENGFDPADMTGHEDLAKHGFNLRDALGDDLEYIATKADAVAVLPGWENSSGAKAEVATAHALGLPVAPYEAFEAGNHIDDWVIHPTAKPSGTVEGVNQSGEVRTTSSTGGQKGVKPERHSLLPVGALNKVARHYGIGAEKYARDQWRRGYEWSKSYDAMQRHATAFWAGEDIDEETQSPHMAAVAFHALALLTFMDEHPNHDDRYKEQS